MPTPEKDHVDASINFVCWFITLPFHFGTCPYQTTLSLEREEAIRTDVTVCGQNESRRPYGELGSVDKGNCCCFVQANSAFGPISPGCGCDESKVDFIVRELKRRMTERGDTAQIKRAEEQIEMMSLMDAKLDLIMGHLDIPTPMKMNER